jgi:hypothetical protein
MTESVTPPDPPLVDPETGETAPLSPQRLTYLDRLRADPERYRKFIEGYWDVTIDEVVRPDDAA